MLEKSNDKLVLNKRTIERYLNKNGYTHDMPLEKHELTQKKRLIKVLKGIYWSWPQPNIFLMIYLELEKLSKENEKNRGKA